MINAFQRLFATPDPRLPRHRLRALLPALASALAALACASAMAFPTGSPVCTVDPAAMERGMGASLLTSPNGWSFNVPAVYTPGVATTITIRNTDTSKRFRGILIWLTRPDGTVVGTWTQLSSAFQLCTTALPLNTASLTHSSRIPKLQQAFTYLPPSTETTTLTAHAVVVEECGLGLNQCLTAHAFFNTIALPSIGVMNVDASAMSTRYDAATDGVLLLRYLFGFTGAALTNGALGSLPSRNAAQIVAHLDSNRMLLDVDGDNEVHALSDGLLILRYLLGLRNTALTAGVALGSLTPDQIAARILIVAP